jgi:hypothetical protein
MIDTSIAAVAAARLFERLGVPYVLAGSVASSLVGEPRTTFDVDFAVHLPVLRVDALVSAATADFMVDLEDARAAARSNRLFNMIHNKVFAKVDVHVVPRSGLNQSEIERGRWMRLVPSTEEVLVATPEDIVLQKLIWFESGERVSEQQWRDVLGILKVRRGALDLGYMKRWARETGTIALLERALKEVPLRKGEPPYRGS